MADIQCATAEIRRGIKKIERNHRAKNNVRMHLLRMAAITNNRMKTYMACPMGGDKKANALKSVKEKASRRCQKA